MLAVDENRTVVTTCPPVYPRVNTMNSRIIVGHILALLILFTFTACDSTGTDNASGQTAQESQPAETVAEPKQEPAVEADTETEADKEVIAYGRFVSEREDDFTWENDKVAFRIYGPSSNGKGQVSGVDAWLKKVPYSIIDKWYAEHLSGTSYHEDQGEGYDPFHVGDSRGVGGTAVWVDGVAWPAGKYETYEVHESGNDVVSFTVTYSWDTPLGEVAENKTVSLRLGDQLYHVSSVFTLDGEPAKLPIAIGLTTHDEKAQVSGNAELGRISTSEAIDEIGIWTGALLNPARVIDVVHVPSEEKDASHIWLLTTTSETGELGFRAGFAWEAAGEITSFEAWNEYLDSRAGQ